MTDKRLCPECKVTEMWNSDKSPRCWQCHNRINGEIRAARKAQLAAEPRCEVAGCKRRGTYEVGCAPQSLMCGTHLKQARVAVMRMGITGFLGSQTATGKTLVSLASQPS